MPSSGAFLSNFSPTNLGNQALTYSLWRLISDLYAPRALTPFDHPPRLRGPVMWCPESLRGDASVTSDRRFISGRRLLPASQFQPPELRMREKSVAGGLSSKRRIALRKMRSRWPVKPIVRAAQMARFRQELAELSMSDQVIYNAAGEFNTATSEMPILRLTQLWAARQTGSAIAMVNYSLEPASTAVVEAASAVFPTGSCFFPRDRYSADVSYECGAPLDAVHLVPDAAFLVDSLTDDERELADARWKDMEAPIAVALSGHLGVGHEQEWIEVVRRVLKEGSPVVLVSSEYDSDIELMRSVAESCSGNVSVAPPFVGYREYMAYLGRCSLVLSSRLHTFVLAVVSGAPSMAIDQGKRKLTSALETVGLDRAVVPARERGWAECVMHPGFQPVHLASDELDTIRGRVTSAYTAHFPMLQQ